MLTTIITIATTTTTNTVMKTISTQTMTSRGAGREPATSQHGEGLRSHAPLRFAGDRATAMAPSVQVRQDEVTR